MVALAETHHVLVELDDVGAGSAPSRQPSAWNGWPVSAARASPGPGHEDPGHVAVGAGTSWRSSQAVSMVGVAELVARDQRAQEADVGGEPEDRGVVERVDQRRRAASRSGPWTITLPSIGSYDVLTTCPVSSACVDPGPRRGHRTRSRVPACGQEAAEGVLGVDPGLDRVPVQRDVVLGERQRLAGGDPQLELDQVEARRRPASVTGCSTCRRVFISRK